jgi:hypothetical protein
MDLEGSCYCGRIRFTVVSHTPYPYLRCYCTVCRKTAGAGGYAVNIMAQADTLRVTGEEHLGFHQARIEDEAQPGRLKTSPGKRYFCRHCGSPLWVADPRWAGWIYPFAGAIDTPLPAPPERAHMMLDFRAPWCEPSQGERDVHFGRYPDEGIAEWHERHGLHERRR